jgi:hypothetical protein
MKKADKPEVHSGSENEVSGIYQPNLPYITLDIHHLETKDDSIYDQQ